jgi:ribosome-interacting GTPase 1
VGLKWFLRLQNTCIEQYIELVSLIFSIMKGGQQQQPLLLRPSNHVKAALIGMPNSGKSMLFNAFQGGDHTAEVDNFLFTTTGKSITNRSMTTLQNS